MPDTLAQRVRAKHPGAYDDLSDPQLEAAVVKKFPGVYDDLPKTDAKPKAPLWKQAMPVTAGIADLARGAVAGAASTVFHGGDMIRRGLGMERVIDTPEVQSLMRAPESFAGKAGKFLEQGAEFAVPLTKVSKAVKGAGVLKRMAAEAGASAGVGAVQTGGDTASTVAAGVLGGALPVAGALVRGTGRVVQRAAAGAKEGGVGGALAGAVRTVAPGEPRTLLIQGLKPANTKIAFPALLDRAIPEIKAAEQALGKPIQGVDDLIAATKAAKQDIQAQLNHMRGPQRAIGAEVDLSSVADAMVKSIPRKVQFETPAVAKRLAARANVYRTPVSLEEAEILLRETNAELDGFYKMFPQAKGKALLSSPDTAMLEAQAKALRDAIYKKLDDPGQGAAARELNRRYGALMEVENAAQRRSMVAARQQPESLSEQIGMVRAAGQAARGTWRALHGDVGGLADLAAASAGRATAKAIKESQTTDALITRAFAGYKGQRVPVAMPAQRPIAGLLPAGARRTGPAPDTSFVRGVPAMRSQSERLALPPGRPSIVTPAAADPSFVRGVPADVVRRETRGLLPPASRPMPAPETSGGGGVPAKSIVVRDPRTGRMRRIYVSDSAK